MEESDKIICRICTKDGNNFSSIYEIVEEYKKTLAEMLNAISRFKIEKGDSLPKHICNDCYIEALNAFAFKEKVEQSHKKLIKLKVGESKNDQNAIEEHDHPNLDKSTQTENNHKIDYKNTDIPKILKEETIDNRKLILEGTTCPICNRTFSRKDHTKEHILKIHKEDPKKYFESRYGCKPKDIKCQLCGREFNRRHHLTRHLMTVHKQDLKSASVNVNKAIKRIEKNAAANDSNRRSFEKNPIGSDLETEEEMICDTSANSNFDAPIKDEPDDSFNAFEDNTKAFFKVEALEEETHKFQDIFFNEPNVKMQTEDSSDNDSEPLIKIKNLLTRRRNGTGEGTPEERTCQLCKRVFSRQCHLRRHMQSMHTEEKPHSCPHCEKRFSRSDLLKNHIESVHEEKIYKCDLCEKAFSRKKALERHRRTPHGPNSNTSFDCEICERTFSKKRFLKRHQLLHSDRVFACRHCEETFQDRKLFNEHERGHKPETKDFLCSICGESFGRIDYLRIHVKRHLGDKNYKCQYCEKCFIRRSDLKEHERYHTNTKPNVCKICGKGFVCRSKLTIHMRIHTGEKPYKCEHCSKSFAQRNDLKAHVRRHTGERFRCDQCDGAFLQLYGLRQHALNAHGIVIEASTGRLEKVEAPCL